jgi:hypothetical protein
MCEECIDEAVKDLEKEGWARESVKVIGAFPSRSDALCLSMTASPPLRRDEPARNDRRLVAHNGQAALPRDRVGRRADEKPRLVL